MGKFFNPFRYGMAAPFKCLLFPWNWYLPLLMMFGFRWKEDAAAKHDPAEFLLVILPDFRAADQSKILGTACRIFKPFGYTKETLAAAVHNYLEAVAEGQGIWDVKDFFELTVNKEEREWVLAQVKKYKGFRVHYDQYEKWFDQYKRIEGEDARLKAMMADLEERLMHVREEAIETKNAIENGAVRTKHGELTDSRNAEFIDEFTYDPR